MKQLDPARYERMNPCVECGQCKGTVCEPARINPMRPYTGIRFTADSFDCALPVSIDSHSHCAYACQYCTPPEAPVLMADGSWRPIGEVAAGDRVMGMARRGSGRAGTEVAQVEAAFRRDAPLQRVWLSSGRQVVCTPDHRWYTQGRGLLHPQAYRPATVGARLQYMWGPHVTPPVSREYMWGYLHGVAEGDGCFTDEDYSDRGYSSKGGSHIVSFRLAAKDHEMLDRFGVYALALGVPLHWMARGPSGLAGWRIARREAVSALQTREAGWGLEYRRGWLAGIYDAEGSLSGALRIAQYAGVNPETYERIADSLGLFGFQYRREPSGVRLLGSVDEKGRMVALLDPAIPRRRDLTGLGRGAGTRAEEVVGIEPLPGRHEVVSMRTSTGNYISQGYHSRNCFSDNLMAHIAGTRRPVGQTSLRDIEALFSGGGGKDKELFRFALKYHNKVNGYPCPVQVGAINDPCDHIERQQGWLLKFIDLAIRYQQPVRISTKGTIFQVREYLDAVARAPELFWVAFSIISPDDALMARVDRRAPSPTERIKTMAMLSSVGVKTSLRFRPMLPGLSDRTPSYPHAWRTLIDQCADAGARAISYEVAFVPGVASAGVKERWHKLEEMTGVPLFDTYHKFGPTAPCMRPAYTWTEEIMHRVAEHAHERGMTVGVSDPVWKQLGDTGCCCGILPDDPVFGNWLRESATNQLLEAKATGKELSAADVVPEWANRAGMAVIMNTGVGPTAVWERNHTTWGDKLRAKWNDPANERGPLKYFQGALMPTRRDEKGNLYFKYVGLERHYQPTDWVVR